ncbi:MAG: hypothetical protein ABFS14_09915 [Gemmatimonadota bacterium]
MVSVGALWLPILVAAVLIFIVSTIIHAFLGYHNSDFRGVPNEEGLRAALRPLNIPAGDYIVPHAKDANERRTEEFMAKAKEGPIVFMTVLGADAFKMGPSLIQWFVYCLMTGAFAAYLTGGAYGPGAEYMAIFGMSGTVAFLGYGWALLQQSIWTKKNWAATGKSLFDAWVYGLVTAGTFGWLWPA